MTRHLRLYGRVQGVWYRDSMRRQAEALGLAGWVRNRRDGSVEAMVQGTENAVASIIEWAMIGPPGACVERCEISEGQGDFASFERLPTE